LFWTFFCELFSDCLRLVTTFLQGKKSRMNHLGTCQQKFTCRDLHTLVATHYILDDESNIIVGNS